MVSAGQRGSAALWTLVLLPLSLTFTVLAVDVSAWMALSDRLQREADRMAMQAANALPDKERAQTIVDASSQALSSQIPNLTAAASFPNNASVEVNLSADYNVVFDNYVALFGETKPLTFKAKRLARAAIVPSDVVIILPDGGTLAPSYANGIPEPSWGDPVNWPASTFFARFPSAVPISDGSGSIWNNQQDSAFRRWLTQSCFNPVYSAIKEAAIGLSNAILEQETNRLAVYFTPGNPADGGATALRHLRSEAAANGRTFLKGWIGGFGSSPEPSAHWPSYSDPVSGASDAACILFSSPETTMSARYALHDRELYGDCTTPLKQIGPDLVFNPYKIEAQLNACYFEERLRLEEAIYWHAVRRRTDGTTTSPNLNAALVNAYNEFPTPDGSYFERERKIRGQLASFPQRRVILITDYLPAFDSRLAEIMNQLAAVGRTGKSVDLAVVALDHDGLDAVGRNSLKLATKVWEAWQPPSGLKLRVLSAGDPEAALKDILTRLLVAGRQIALQR